MGTMTVTATNTKGAGRSRSVVSSTGRLSLNNIYLWRFGIEPISAMRLSKSSNVQSSEPEEFLDPRHAEDDLAMRCF
jgi:hypothetical protein